jgi:hypothetical protein
MVAGLIAQKIPSPLISYPLIFLSHHLMDFVPHWDTGTGVRSNQKSKRDAIIHTIYDLAIAATLFYLVFQKPLGNTISWKMWGAAFVAILPDLIEAPALFLNIKPFPINYLEKFHMKLHKRLNFPWGLVTQLPFIIGAIILSKLLV